MTPEKIEAFKALCKSATQKELDLCVLALLLKPTITDEQSQKLKIMSDELLTR
jgi:Trp operon repressor